MDEKKHVYEAEVMALPPLRLVLGDIPAPIQTGATRPVSKHTETGP